MISGVERTAKAVAAMSGASAPEIAIRQGARAVVNDEALATSAGAFFRAAFGDQARLIPRPAQRARTEFILAGVPSNYFLIAGFEPEQLEAARSRGEPSPVAHTST